MKHLRRAFVIIVVAVVLLGVGGPLAYEQSGGSLETIYEECFEVSFRRDECVPLDEPRRETRSDKIAGAVVAGLIVGGSAAALSGLAATYLWDAAAIGGPRGLALAIRPAIMWTAVAAAPFGLFFLFQGLRHDDWRAIVGISLSSYAAATVAVWSIVKVVRHDISFFGEGFDTSGR